ncbi:MAG: hypothetical protein HY222_08665 [Thaumarchaeota archaeon]|nr:hypothetical protein [Nitrososphaerota archaeon]MBI3642444.1 hypothetical protein [Nitrososphaerota archaeon]
MDLKILPEKLSLLHFPVGLGGCRNDCTNFQCCEYNITIFDDKQEEPSIHEIDGNMIKLHHGSLSEINVGILEQFEDMKVLIDEQWKLRMFLTKIKTKRKQISNSYVQNCLVDAGVYAAKAKELVKSSDPLAHVWIKCAAYFLADAIFSINSKRPSPTHMLETIRGFDKNKINQNFSVVHQCLGIERASTSLLSRMVKSTIGFSDMVEKNDHSKIIQQKYDYLIQNSLLSDCYFYLGYINRNNVIKTKDTLHRNLEYAHLLKIALDTESDPLVVERQAILLLKTTNDLLTTVKN